MEPLLEDKLTGNRPRHPKSDFLSAVTVKTSGSIFVNVMEACADLQVNLVYFHTLNPVDREFLARFQQPKILVVEDAFGLADAIHEVLSLNVTVHVLSDQFCVQYGTPPDIRKMIRLDDTSTRQAVQDELK